MSPSRFRLQKWKLAVAILACGMLAAWLWSGWETLTANKGSPENFLLGASESRFNDFTDNVFSSTLGNPYDEPFMAYPPSTYVFLRILSHVEKPSLVFLDFLSLTALAVLLARVLPARITGAWIRMSWAFLFLALSYPLLFCLERGNIEIVLIPLMGWALYFFSQRRDVEATACLFPAICLKLFPALLLIFLLRRKKVGLAILCAVGSLAVIASSFCFFPASPGEVWNSYGQNLAFYRDFTDLNGSSVESSGSPWNAYLIALIAMLKWGLISNLNFGFDSALIVNSYHVYLIGFALLTLGCVIYVWLYESSFMRSAIILLLLISIAATNGGEYRLAYASMALVLLVLVPQRRNGDWIALVLIALAVIPKREIWLTFVTPSSPDQGYPPIQALLNPVLIPIAMFILLYHAFKPFASSWATRGSQVEASLSRPADVIVQPQDLPEDNHKDVLARFIPWTFHSGFWIAVFLAIGSYVIYRSSLSSDFVYDARKEILDEGFITSLSNLPAVLSLKVLNMPLMLGPRPGQMLYLMFNAALWDKEPFGYHLSSNLLHAANVGLLYMLLVRLAKTERADFAKKSAWKIHLIAAVATLIFALHPIAVESVAEISYSSSLLVTFFLLVALLAATVFKAENARAGIFIGALGAFCAFAAVTCKESGVTVALVLMVYWFLFRRNEAKPPWILFLSAATAMTVAFLTLRFMFPPPPDLHPLTYAGGSFFQSLWIQPRLWVFMMGKLVWPAQLSAVYTLNDVNGLSTFGAMTILALVILLQIGLALKSRVGALGVAFYWLGLVAVSNFDPLYHPIADRYYYLPLAGFSMQILALLLLTLRWGVGFWLVIVPCFVAMIPLTFLTLSREEVFANNLALWRDTVKASPFSETAHYGLGMSLSDRGQWNEAIVEFNKALKLNSDDYEAHNGLGIALFQMGKSDEAIGQFQKSLEFNPDYAQARYNLGLVFLKKKQMNDATIQFQEALHLKPNDPDARDGLAKAKAGGTP